MISHINTGRSMGMRIYLAGPMRGLPNLNREAFDYWAAKLRADGHEVFSPAENNEKIYGAHIYRDNPEGDEGKAGIDGRVVFEHDLVWICRHADAVALMPGWENSKGAKAERAVAEALGAAVGMQVIEL
jgi:nucleoside 2-deoxyribosyltransferase